MAQEKCFHHGDTSLRAGLQAPASGRVAPSGPPSSDDLLESNLFSSSLHTQADCTVHQNLFYKRSHLRTWPPPTADTSVIIPCQGLGSVLLKPGTTEKPCRSLKIVQASQSKPTPPPPPILIGSVRRQTGWLCSHKLFAPPLPHITVHPWEREARISQILPQTSIRGPSQGYWTSERLGYRACFFCMVEFYLSISPSSTMKRSPSCLHASVNLNTGSLPGRAANYLALSED